MITTRPDNWREIRDEEDVSFISAEKFEKLISKNGYFFFTETSKGSSQIRYIRVKEPNKKMTRYELGRKRTHNIVVDTSDKSIAYEGTESIWHEVYGPEGSYEKLLGILNNKTREV